MTESTRIDIADATAAARRVQQVGVDWGDSWSGLKATIEAGEGAVPFGRDELGQQLLASYAPAADALKPAAVKVSVGYTTLAQGIDGAIQSVVDQDAATAHTFGS